MNEKIALEVLQELKKYCTLNLNLNEVHSALESVFINYEIVPKNIKNDGLNFDNGIEYFLSCKSIEGLSESTIKNYRYKLKKVSQKITKKLENITVQDMRAYIYNYSTTNKQSTVINLINILKTFFGWCLSESLIQCNPMDRIVVPKRNKYLRKYLSVTQIEQLRNSCSTLRERALIEFLLSTGCRVNEITQLKIKDIIDNSIKVIGKGNKERIVYINEKSRMYLNEYITKRKNKGEYIFMSEREPYTYIKSAAIQKIVNKIGERANINVSPHIFRHSCASHLLQNGCSLVTLQEILGHDNLGTTQIYARTNNRIIRNEHETHSVI